MTTSGRPQVQLIRLLNSYQRIVTIGPLKPSPARACCVRANHSEFTMPAAANRTAPAPTSTSPESGDLRSFYEENGYAIARGAIDSATVARLTTDFDRVVEQMEGSGENLNGRWDLETTAELDAGRSAVVVHTHQIQKFSAEWAKFCFNEQFLDLTQQLLGPDIILHHSKLFLKPAGHGAAFPPHQDFGYFPTTVHSMLAAVLFLSPSNEDNGCVRVWPGSHRLGPIADNTGGNKEVAARFPFEQSVPAICAPGDILFFSYLTVHGSLANRGVQARKSVLFQLHAGIDRMVESASHPSSNLVLRGWNHHMTRDRANAS